jgi:arsenical resistance operon trans-acting repressor ArsD
MTIVTVYDPPMCCSTGICGPEVDPKLAQFAGDLDWLKARGVEVRRINLAQEPGRFVENDAVKAILDRSGGDELPAILIGDELIANGRYPSREELAALVGLKAAPTAMEMVEPFKEAATGACCVDAKATGAKAKDCC